MDELMEQFLIESRELVQQASDDLIALVANPTDEPRIDSAFRAIHTLKGSVAIFDFPPMLSALHAAEDLLSHIRSHRKAVDKSAIDVLLQCVTASDAWIESIASTGSLSNGSAAESERLQSLLRSIVSPEENSSSPEAVAPPQPGPESATAPASSNANRMLRVDGAQVDAVADVVGELIVAKNALRHLASKAASVDPSLGRALKVNHSDMDRLIGDLHRSVARLRMVPLERTFRRFPRLVRDMATKLEKDVDLELVGEDVEADKTIVDGLYEPLLHILRNALDHGIETPEKRLSTGKSGTGRIRLEARNTGNDITVTVSDDGNGLDVGKVRETATRKGLVSPAAADHLDQSELLDLIFAPGFSTSSSVTEVSGRGVGMDAVRTSIEALSGTVSLTTAAGSGTVVTLVLPLAVFVSSIMLVRAGGEWFGVPVDVVRETVRVARSRIVPIKHGEAFSLRDRTLPLIRLSDVLGLPSLHRASENARVLVVGSEASPSALEVEEFGERIEAQVRPATGLLAGFSSVLGTTLLGDGKVLMILDIPQVLT